MHRARERSRGGWATFLVLSLFACAEARASVSIQSFSMAPASPDTGDPLVLSAVLQSTSSCDFLGARIGFAAQSELGGRMGWGIDVEFRDGVLIRSTRESPRSQKSPGSPTTAAESKHGTRRPTR